MKSSKTSGSPPSTTSPKRYLISGKIIPSSSPIWSPSSTNETAPQAASPKKSEPLFLSLLGPNVADLRSDVATSPEKYRPELVRFLSKNQNLPESLTKLEQNLLIEGVYDRMRPAPEMWKAAEARRPATPEVQRAPVYEEDSSPFSVSEAVDSLGAYGWLK